MVRGTEDEPSRDALFADQLGRNGRLFFRLAYGVLRDRAAAQDVCQQALLKAWERRKELKDAAKLRNWLARVVVNESLQLRRRGKIEQRILAKQGATVGPIARASADPRSDVHESVLAALGQLPDDVRIVVVMRKMDGLSGNEVKELLGCSAAEVSRLLHQGMELLRGLLGDWRMKSDAGESENNAL